MKTLFLSDGKCYRNKRFNKPRLSTRDRNYLYKTTFYKDKIWTFFSHIETDFRLLVNTPLIQLHH